MARMAPRISDHTLELACRSLGASVFRDNSAVLLNTKLDGIFIVSGESGSTAKAGQLRLLSSLGHILPPEGDNGRALSKR